jgi:serine protease Do
MKDRSSLFIVKNFLVTLILATTGGALTGGLIAYSIVTKDATTLSNNIINRKTNIIKVQEESAVISAVEKASPAVVSIIASKDLPQIQQFQGTPFEDFFSILPQGLIPQQPKIQGDAGKTEKQEVSSGSGFIISSDGYVVTNKHVVSYDDVDYTVVMNNDQKYEAKVLARDPVNDLAVLKIEAKNLPTLELGDSSTLKIGQQVIAIGNALGEFRNTVSTGIVSGLSRSITASGGISGTEQLANLIQTDASINPGNSGGPLLNISGQVIAINTAMANGAQSIGFAIPINELKSRIENIKKNGRIVTPWLGLRYVAINKAMKKANNLSVDYGALVIRGAKDTDLAVIPGSPADKADIMEKDIILKINEQKIDENNQLNKIISNYKSGDEITLTILRKGKEQKIKVVLEERKENVK